MKTLVKKGYSKNDITSFGNMFLIGNGKFGYRGTLEEYKSDNLVALNVAGFYDRYKNLWRETINLPNPFYIYVKNNIESCSVLENEPCSHNISLSIEKAIFSRKTEFKSLIIKSERFVSQSDDTSLLLHYQIKALKDQNIEIDVGLDKNIWDINGPHFKKTNYKVFYNKITFNGKTNENKVISLVATYKFSNFDVKKGETMYHLSSFLKENEVRNIYVLVKIFPNEINRDSIKVNKQIYNDYKNRHIIAFKDKFLNAKITLKGDKNAQDELDYSIYQLLILSNKDNKNSIAARGVSGQTYKGAIFWDTEIFLNPFFIFTDPIIAKNNLLYRINTLKEAKENAKLHHYEGAFYPWESQEGKEMCSKYNVTDVFTNEPIRTYFNEKQIHTSADMVNSLEEYIKFTNDYSLLELGGLEMMKECIKFYMSYKKVINNKYHFFDVIGPDEYHERVNDNFFTNYSIKKASEVLVKYLPKNDTFRDEVVDFIDKIYIPKQDKNGIFEQFDGYFDLEDVKVEDVRKRIRHKNEYWGGKLGVATKTRVIKQADVVATLMMFKDDFSLKDIKNNYNFYLPYTEHGSSLSSSIYSLCALLAKDYKTSYKMFRQSSSIDLGTNQKMYAGGIYIGGTHPASNAGAYLGVIRGFAGIYIDENNQLNFKPNLIHGWKMLSFKINFRNKKYQITINRKDVKIEEIL